MSIETFPHKEKLVEKLAQRIAESSQRALQDNRLFHICLSGGSTPKALFRYLREEHRHLGVCWKALNFFWGDERYVSRQSGEHNSGEACRLLFDAVDIGKSQVNEWQTEIPSEDAAVSYSALIREKLTQLNAASGVPQFDLMLLGLGDDGHTASLFPGSDPYFNRKELCYATHHPETQQTRLTISLNVINSSRSVVFLVTGRKKADITPQVVGDKNSQYPASHVNPSQFGGSLEWYLDAEAAQKLK